MRIKILTLYLICQVCNLLTAQTVQWSVKPTYSSLEEYVGKLYKYRENGKVGLVDISGKVLVEARYDSITRFIDYHALAYSNGMLKGIINQNNLKLVEVPDGYFPSKDYPFFSEGKLVIYDTSRKYGYMQTDGSLFMKCEFQEAFPFYHGRALVYKDRSTAEYLKDNGDVLNTQLEVEEYCTLLPSYCSAFNEEGLALIKGKPGASAAKDMVIDVWGKKVNKVKPKNYEERVSFYAETSHLMPIPSESHILPVEENGLFGFQLEGKDSLCVPAQFAEAYPFKDGYAKVKYNGKYGVLKLIPDASFKGEMIWRKLEVVNGKTDSLIYVLNIPQPLYDLDWDLKLKDELSSVQPYSFKNIADGEIQIAFKPELKNKEKVKEYELSLYVDELLLWEDKEKVTIEYIYRSNISVSAPEVVENYNRDTNAYFLADEYRKLKVYSLIENKSDEDAWIQVVMGAKENQKDLSVKKERIRLGANSVYKFNLDIENINKECDLDIYIQLPDNGIMKNKRIKVKPVY